MLVHSEPLAVFDFENYGPAEISHLNFSSLTGHLLMDCRGRPDQVPLGMNFGVVIDGELRALVSGKHAFHTLLIFFPTVVLERGDIEKGMWASGIKLCGIRGI